VARKKKHHYVPVFYLNGFIDPSNRPYVQKFGDKAEEKVKEFLNESVKKQEELFK